MAEIRIIPSMQSYSASDWAEKQAMITELYLNGRKSLREIRKILAQQHGFFPTDAMLKKRIHKWGIDKNIKLQDMLMAVQYLKHRQAENKQTEFIIRSRVVTCQHVRRYFRKRGTPDISVLSTNPINPAACYIEVYTPPATPRTEDFTSPEPQDLSTIITPSSTYQTEIHDHGLSISEEQIVAASPTTDRVYAPLSSPAELGQFEQVVSLTHSYHDAAFDVPNWKQNKQRFQLDRLEHFYHDMFDGQSDLEAGQTVLAFAIFDKAFNAVNDILKSQALLFLPYLYHLMLPLEIVTDLPFGSTSNQAIINHLLFHVGKMSGIYLPGRNPINQVMSIFLQMSAQDRSSFAKHTIRPLLDRVCMMIESVNSKPFFQDLTYPVSRQIQHSPFTFQGRSVALQAIMDDFAIKVKDGGDHNAPLTYTSCSSQFHHDQFARVVWATRNSKSPTMPTMERRLSRESL